MTQLNPHQTVCWWYVTVYVSDPIHLSGDACKRGSMAIASPKYCKHTGGKNGKEEKGEAHVSHAASFLGITGKLYWIQTKQFVDGMCIC